MLKVGDKVRGISFKGVKTVTKNRTGYFRREFPLYVGECRYTAAGLLHEGDEYPSIWLAETGHGPEIGERPIEYPLVMQTKNDLVIVEFTGLTTGTIVEQGDSSVPVGYTSELWMPHTNRDVWEPCERPV